MNKIRNIKIKENYMNKMANIVLLTCQLHHMFWYKLPLQGELQNVIFLSE